MTPPPCLAAEQLLQGDCGTWRATRPAAQWAGTPEADRNRFRQTRGEGNRGSSNHESSSRGLNHATQTTENVSLANQTAVIPRIAMRICRPPNAGNPSAAALN